MAKQLSTNVTGHTGIDEFAVNAADRNRIVVNALNRMADAAESEGDGREAHVLREYAYNLQQSPCTCGQQQTANTEGTGTQKRPVYIGNGGGPPSERDRPTEGLPQIGIDWSKLR